MVRSSEPGIDSGAATWPSSSSTMKGEWRRRSSKSAEVLVFDPINPPPQEQLGSTEGGQHNATGQQPLRHPRPRSVQRATPPFRGFTAARAGHGVHGEGISGRPAGTEPLPPISSVQTSQEVSKHDCSSGDLRSRTEEINPFFPDSTF